MSATLLRTELPNGRVVTTFRISPRDHAGAHFEALVFGGGRNDFHVLDVARYGSEPAARRGHAELIARWGPTL